MLYVLRNIFQIWVDVFRGILELKEIDKVYQDLKVKGIEFLMIDLDYLVLIYILVRVG